MNAYADIAWSRQLARTSAGQRALWTLAALVMLTAHAGAGWWVMRERPAPAADEAPPAAVMIELAPIPVAPEPEAEEQVVPEMINAQPVDAPPATEPVEPVEVARLEDTPTPVEPVVEPEPLEPVTETAEPVVEPEPLEPVAEDEVAEIEPEVIEPIEEVDPIEEMVVAELDRVEVPLPTARPAPPRVRQVRREEPRPRPQVERPRRERTERPTRRERPAPARTATRAQVQAERAPRPAAQQTSRGGGASVSPARWESRLRAHLERRKRYPSEARRARKEGVAHVRFSIDAGGNVRSVSLARSSGVAELDQEVVAMVRRASPVPAPPPGVPLTITVPVRFNLR